MGIPRDQVGIKCLNCGHVQVPPNRDSMDNWSCNYCFSGIISLRMLRNIAPDELTDQLDKHGPAKAKTGRACALCSKKMELVSAIYNQKIIDVEVCHRCRVLWFDSGELMRMLRHRSDEELMAHAENAPEPQRPKRGIYSDDYQERLRHYEELGLEALDAPLESVRGREAVTVPWITYSLLAVCFLVMPPLLRFPELLSRFSFLPSAPLRMHGLTLLTSCLIHEGPGHTLKNLFLLAVLGSYVEISLGRRLYFSLFLISSLMGPLLNVLFARDMTPLQLGLTPFVSALVTFFILQFPFSKSRLFMGTADADEANAPGLTGSGALLLYIGIQTACFLISPPPPPAGAAVSGGSGTSIMETLATGDGGNLAVGDMYVGAIGKRLLQPAVRMSLLVCLAGAFIAFILSLALDAPKALSSRPKPEPQGKGFFRR